MARSVWWDKGRNIRLRYLHQLNKKCQALSFAFKMINDKSISSLCQIFTTSNSQLTHILLCERKIHPTQWIKNFSNKIPLTTLYHSLTYRASMVAWNYVNTCPTCSFLPHSDLNFDLKFDLSRTDRCRLTSGLIQDIPQGKIMSYWGHAIILVCFEKKCYAIDLSSRSVWFRSRS